MVLALSLWAVQVFLHDVKALAYTERFAGHAGAVHEAARAAAAEVLQRLQQEGRLGDGVHPIGGPVQGTSGSNGAGQAAAANGAPKGYKGDPNDTRADAFKKMQVWLWTGCCCCLSQLSSAEQIKHRLASAAGVCKETLHDSWCVLDAGASDEDSPLALTGAADLPGQQQQPIAASAAPQLFRAGRGGSSAARHG